VHWSILKALAVSFGRTAVDKPAANIGFVLPCATCLSAQNPLGIHPRSIELEWNCACHLHQRDLSQNASRHVLLFWSEQWTAHIVCTDIDPYRVFADWENRNLVMQRC